MIDIIKKRRKEVSRKRRFSALISSPFSLGSIAINNPSPNALVLPDSCDVGVSSTVAISQGQLIITTSTGRTLGTPNLTAGQVWRVGFFEKGVTLRLRSSLAGTARLHFLDHDKKPSLIGSGIFT